MFQKKLSIEQIKAVLSLPPQKRYQHSIKQMVGWGKIWGLYNNGWALMGDEVDNKYFPIWPAPDYAELCASDYWRDYKPKEIELEVFIDEILTDLKEKNIYLAVFTTPQEKGLTPTYDQFINDINFELSHY